MASITLKGNFDPVQSALKGIAAIGQDPQAVLAAIGPLMVRSTRHRIEQGVDPEGAPFEPLNPLYALTKEGPGILRGRAWNISGLYASMTSQVRGNVLVWGSGKPYAPVHQFGAVIQPKKGNHLSFEMGGHLFHVDSVFVPARPFLGFTEQDREDVVDALEGFLRRAMRRG
ncbi:virion morphogenesis protein [Gluconobacter potus]|uniref:Virion morphogenesis protein n=1 Tax=Gluconobacter potus TaxID=2724927 RepID=A0A149QSI1_9PROT|nr:phage virion morphogenesis protein [Gluconobacter potus]KXV00276.1 virion morphogenesis protein [Gluconobacter potus]